MRLTIHLPENLGEELREAARSRRKSLSSLAAEAIRFYIREERKRRAIDLMLALAGKGNVAPDTLDELDRMRKEDENRF